jgi:S1-C subfamily serine protease
VAKASPGDEIGLRGATMIATIARQDVPLGGDIVLSVEGIPFSATNVATIRDALSRLSPGDPFRVRILRAGDVLELTGRAR